jgi:hypothetical protein
MRSLLELRFLLLGSEYFLGHGVVDRCKNKTDGLHVHVSFIIYCLTFYCLYTLAGFACRLVVILEPTLISCLPLED